MNLFAPVCAALALSACFHPQSFDTPIPDDGTFQSATPTDEQRERCRLAVAYSKSKSGYAVLILQNDRVICEDYHGTTSQPVPHHLYSGTKSFACALAVSLADEGVLGLDDLVSDTVSDWKSDPLKSRITVMMMLMSGCAHVATLRPAAKGSLEVELTAGGPVVKQGTVAIPASLTSLGARYGVHDRVDIQAHFHPTAALLGVLGLDLGTSVLAVKGDRAIPDITATARLFAFTDFKRTFRPNLQLGAVASWRLFNRFAPYLGFDWMGAGPYWGVAVGLQGTFGRFTAHLEAKWFGVGEDLRSLVVEWVSPNDIGTFGVQFGVSYRFGADG